MNLRRRKALNLGKRERERGLVTIHSHEKQKREGVGKNVIRVFEMLSRGSCLIRKNKTSRQKGKRVNGVEEDEDDEVKRKK